jgi:RNA polymerase sigma factor (TIGR02999 family)
VNEDRPVTGLLQAWRSGSREAESALLDALYGDLHRRAARLLRRERRDHTLRPTALVNEAYLRLLDQREVDWQDRAHFLAIAARTMRRVLLDHARKHLAGKRGDGRRAIPLELAGELGSQRHADLIALDDTLKALHEFDPEGARVVELKFFGGLTTDEAAEVLGCSASTIERSWRAARAWLFTQLDRGHAEAGEPAGPTRPTRPTRPAG